MNNFTFYSPTFFAFGKDTENEAGTYVKQFGGSKVLIHYGGGSVVRSGLLDRVKKSLEDAGVDYRELGGVKPNPRSGPVYEGIDMFERFLRSIGMPTTFAELGAKEEDIPKLVDVLCNGDGRDGNIYGFVKLTAEDCTKIYKMMVK
jgi:alcohol dehydrogenase YqhD (iron-dependent ADH family)